MAYDHVLRGLESHYRYTKEENEQAQGMFQKAIDLDPDYAAAYAFLSLALLHSWTQGWKQDPQILPKAFDLAQKAIHLNDALPEAHMVLGDLHLFAAKDHDKAILAFKNAIARNPNYADAYAGLAHVLVWAGKAADAIDRLNQAMRLNPHHQAWYFFPLGMAYLQIDQLDEAIEACRRGLIRNPDFMALHLLLAGVYAELGKEAEAWAEIKEVLRISPGLSLHIFRQRVPTMDSKLVERMVTSLRKAGLQ